MNLPRFPPGGNPVFPRIFPGFPPDFPRIYKTSIISKIKGIVFPDFLYFIREVVIDNPRPTGTPNSIVKLAPLRILGGAQPNPRARAAYHGHAPQAWF